MLSMLLQWSLCLEGSIEDVTDHGLFSRVILVHGLAGLEAGLRCLAFGCGVFFKVFGMLKSQAEEINVGVLPSITIVMAFVSYCHVQKLTLLCLPLSLSLSRSTCLSPRWSREKEPDRRKSRRGIKDFDLLQAATL